MENPKNTTKDLIVETMTIAALDYKHLCMRLDEYPSVCDMQEAVFRKLVALDLIIDPTADQSNAKMVRPRCKMLPQDRRKPKRRVNHAIKKLRVGMYAEGCNSHPGIIIESISYDQDPFASEVIIKSLIDGRLNSCSILHCSPEPLSKQEAEFRARIYPVLNEAWKTLPDCDNKKVELEFEGKRYAYGYEHGLVEIK